MRNKVLILIGGLLLYACTPVVEKENEGRQSDTKASVFEEYKASELAALMRQMDNEMQVLRESVLRGDTVAPEGLRFDYAALHTATPTDSSSITPGYHEMSDAFLEAVARFRQEEPAKETYNMVIETCLACHRQLCPGPVQRIQKLHIP